jgi:phosphopantetheinyl transferase
MPLILKKEENNIFISVWKITESLDELTVLYPNIKSYILKTEKRKKEFICSRVLLNLYSKNLKISYSKFGNPVLNNNQFISISHCSNLVCIAISKENIGIDLEEISDKTIRLQSKFVNDHHSELNKEKTTLIWCIKESVFKYHKIGGVDFKKDIYIPKFTETIEGELEVTFKNELLKSNYFKIENQFLVYICK